MPNQYPAKEYALAVNRLFPDAECWRFDTGCCLRLHWLKPPLRYGAHHTRSCPHAPAILKRVKSHKSTVVAEGNDRFAPPILQMAWHSDVPKGPHSSFLTKCQFWGTKHPRTPPVAGDQIGSIVRLLRLFCTSRLSFEQLFVGARFLFGRQISQTKPRSSRRTKLDASKYLSTLKPCFAMPLPAS